MSRSAAASAPSLPMGFRLDPEQTVIENARAAWEARKAVHLTQVERNARVLARHVLPGVDADEIVFSYDEGLYPDVPTFVLDDELIAYNRQRNQFAVIEVCGGCAKHWRWNHFDNIAALGRELSSRDARDPFLCPMCEVLESSAKKGK